MAGSRLRYRNAACAAYVSGVRLWVSSYSVRLPRYGGRDALRVVISMSTASRSPSLLRLIAWACFGPVVAVGGLAVLVFGFGVLAVCARLILALFGHGGV